MKMIVWEHLCWGDAGAGLECLVLDATSARSTMLWVDESRPVHLTYDAAWRDDGSFERIRTAVREADAARTVELSRDTVGVWLLDGAPAPHLHRCAEVDLWPTPFTNSFPIWRLSLEIGGSADIDVAWIHAPDLTVEARKQRYERLDRDAWRFTSLDDGFTADLRVDESGLVVHYPQLFQRLV